MEYAAGVTRNQDSGLQETHPPGAPELAYRKFRVLRSGPQINITVDIEWAGEGGGFRTVGTFMDARLLFPY